MWVLSVFLWAIAALPSNDAAHRSDSLRLHAEKLFDQEKYDESLKYYQLAFQEVAHSDKVRAANLCNDISSAHYGLNQFDESVASCQKGLDILKSSSVRPDSLYFKLYSSLGTMFHRKAQSDSSTYYFLLSDKLLENNALSDEIPEYVLHHYLNQGRAVWRKYRYYDSISYFEKALELSKREKMNSELFYIYSSLAEVHDLLNRHEKALEWRLMAIHEVPEERVQSRLSLYTGVGNTYRLLNKKDSALAWYDKSLQMVTKIPNLNENYKIQHLYILTGLANIHLEKGEAAKARSLLSQAIRLYKQEGLQRAVLHSRILVALGKYERFIGNTTSAIRYFEAAYRQLLSDSLQTGTPDPRSVKHPKFALKALSAKTETVNNRYTNGHNMDDLEESYRLYSDLIILKKESYREVASSIDDRFNYTADTQPIMEGAILNGLEYYEKKKSPELLEALFNRFEDANTTFLMDMVSGGPGENYDNFFSKPLELDQIKRKLDNQTVFVTYKLIGDQLLTFILSKQITEIRRWTINSARLESTLESLLSEIKLNPGLGRYRGSDAAQYCYDQLVRPIQKELSHYKRWVVVRDWKFSSLPFEILEHDKKKYLGDRWRVSYAYSASSFWFHPLLKTKAVNYRDTFVFAPFVKEKEGIIGGWKAVSTQEEVSEMGQGYLTGQEATKQNFTKEGSDHYVLNLATHAFADLKNPNSSYVQFYPGVDSKLYLEEIINMKLEKTRLILLSSCFGNEGSSVSGEGTISLAYAFAQAGCPSLITSNWEANENTISFLTVQISKYIDEGRPLDEALQMARIDLRRNGEYGKYDHPYFWANISLIGNHSPVYQSTFHLSKWGYLLLILPALITALFFLIRRYR
jgi:CHAT domain-containing protein